MKKTALLITALFGASLANAHNVWLEPVKDVKGQYVLNLVMRKPKPILKSKLKAVRHLILKANCKKMPQ